MKSTMRRMDVGCACINDETLGVCDVIVVTLFQEIGSSLKTKSD